MAQTGSPSAVAGPSVPPPFPIELGPIRPQHSAFVYSTWIRHMRGLEPWALLDARGAANWFAAAQHALIAELAHRGGSDGRVVAVSPTNADQIYGYVVAEPSRQVLHWIYVKEDFRGVRIGRRLFDAVFAGVPGPIICTHKTPSAVRVASRWGLRFDNSYLNERR